MKAFVPDLYCCACLSQLKIQGNYYDRPFLPKCWVECTNEKCTNYGKMFHAPVVELEVVVGIPPLV